MGLGLLAGAGALVDYWPADVRLPRTASVALHPALARAHAVPQTLPTLYAANTPTRAARVVVAPSASSLPVASVSVAGIEPFTHDLSDDVAAPVESPTLGVLPAVATTAPAQQVALSLPPATNRVPTDDEQPLRLFSAGENPTAAEGSFFSGAFKVAGDSLANAGGSIVNAGVKTGQSVAGAFRVAAGAVKKLKFF
jgi:hypothetical protein